MLHEQAELTGTVRQGVIVVDEGVELPEGQTVQIILKQPPANGTPQAETAGQQATGLVEPYEDSPPNTLHKAASPLGELLLKYAGVIDDLPSDMTKNHDHYLYGTPKVGE